MPGLSLYQLVSIATFSSLFFLAMLTMSKKSDRTIGYRFLSVFFILLGFNFVDDLLMETAYYSKYPGLMIIFQPSIFAIAPSFYLSVFYLTSIKKKLSPNIILHFVVYLILLILYIISVIISSNTNLAEDDTTSPESSRIFDIIFISLLFTQIFLYLYCAVRLLKKHTRLLPLFVSNINNNDFHWLKNMILGLSLLSFLWLIEVLVNQRQISAFFSLLYLGGFYYIGTKVTWQKDVFPVVDEQPESIAALIYADQFAKINSPDKQIPGSKNFGEEADNDSTILKIFDEKEKKKVMTDENLYQYTTRLLNLMETEKPFLDSEITLPKLGKMLLLNTYQTSYLINTSFGENFFTFINRYRINECKAMLADHRNNHLTILGIAYNSGFNSKTAFNTAFKKVTGLSPRDYKEQVIQHTPTQN